MKASAQAFQAEGKVSSDPVGEMSQNSTLLSKKEVGVNCRFLDFFILFIDFCCLCVCACCGMAMGVAAIDAPGGFLFEWWSVFWDIFIARTNEKHSEVAASYIEVGWEQFSLVSHYATFCGARF